MNSYLFILLFIIIKIHPSSSKPPSKSPECVKNSTDSVHYKPYFRSRKICFQSTNYYLTPFGHQFNFDCAYDSNPPSVIRWTIYNNHTKQFDIIQNLNNSVRLSIPKISLDDEGFYTCTIFNSLGLISYSFQLSVSDTPLAPPTFNHKEEVLSGSKGDKVLLDCTFKTDEPSDLVFQKANNLNNHTFDQLTSMNDVQARAESVLDLIDSVRTFDQLNHTSHLPFSFMIDSLTDDSFGVYMCVAGNRYGKSLKFIKLMKKRIEFNFFILLYIVSSIIVILMILLIFQTYLRSRDKKKLMIEKSYVIKKKIIIDYFAAKNCPQIEIVKERKEIVGKTLSDELNNNEDCFEIDLDPEWEIDRNCLRLDETIGHGNFGVVQRAFLFKLPLTPSLDDSRPIYMNNVCAKGDQPDFKIKNYSPVEYTNVNQMNYNYIIDHFHNNNLNNNITTAFSNNYYVLQDLLQFGDYGRIDLLKLSAVDSQPEQEGRVVAVKKLKDDYSENDVRNFISEMVMMKLYGNHKNIINLIGTCTQDGPFYVIMEYAEKGNLKDFLKNYRTNNCYLPSTIPHERLTTRDLISFALQIAHGMHHLASLHCIHRDLAARNVLVTSNFQMKIADFGLSRNTGDSEYYRKSSDSFVPIKWLAPECISQQLYTVQTDVWSYAVTLWELTSLGSSPYENIDPQDMFLYLKAGKRMNRPQWCNEDMYRLMLDCWNWDPKDRPLFEKIIQYLEMLFQREIKTNYVIYQDLPTPKGSINSEYFR